MTQPPTMNRDTEKELLNLKISRISESYSDRRISPCQESYGKKVSWSVAKTL
jgi:hypothetical protein